MENKNRIEVIEGVKKIARARCKDADPSTIEVLDIEEIPVSYIPGQIVRLRIKVVGNLAAALDTTLMSSADSDSDERNQFLSFRSSIEAPVVEAVATEAKPIPEVRLRIKDPKEITVDPQLGWLVDELDTEYITLGAALLGCGGGGSAYLVLIPLNE
jgi:hypothetical protein